MEHGMRRSRRWLLALGLCLASAMSTAPVHSQQLCGAVSYPFPYTDVAGVGAPFCPGIMEAYVTGVSKGTTPTTFSPDETVSRVQMTTFLQRSLDQGLARTSRRGAFNQWWMPQTSNALHYAPAGGQFCAADGHYIWTSTGSSLVQLAASTGSLGGTWTGAASSQGLVVAAGRIFMVDETSPGSLYAIDPTQPPGAVTSAATLGDDPVGITFDGNLLWTANYGGSVSIITPQATAPYPVTNVTTGFANPYGILYDGAHVWVTDQGAGTLLELDSGGAILRTVAVGTGPGLPAFDGANIWVPNAGPSNSLTVVQASSGNVVATITPDASNRLSGPTAASFDGQRILITNTLGNSVTLFKAADLSFIANVPTGASTTPYGACSDGINFWIAPGGTAISAADTTWTWVPFPDAFCANATTTGIGVNLNSGSKQVLIYLEGGGACWSDLTCNTLQTAANFSTGYGAADFASESTDPTYLALPGGFFDRTTAANPFQDYNYVYVPYCTGDEHAGNNVVTYGGKTALHVGFDNMSAYLKRLVATFPSATQVVLAGSDSGGFGATFNWWQTQQAFGSIPVALIDDSGTFMPPDILALGDGANVLQSTQWNLPSTLPPGCTACATALDAIFGYYASVFPNNRGALLSYIQDSVLPSYYDITTSQFTTGLNEFTAAQFDPNANLHYFTVSGPGHVLFFNPSLTTDGVTVEQFITKMVTGDPTWTTVHP
jgi:hypothetical protein